MEKFCLLVLFFLSTSPVFAATREDDILITVIKTPLDAAAGVFGAVTDTVFDLGFIRVGGGRLESGEDARGEWSSSQSVVRLTGKEIADSVPVFTPEILSRQEGVTYTDDLGQGLGARIDLRSFGGEAKQALVLMDGLRAVEPFDNSVTWHLYPSEYLEQIHILPGGGSASYGEGALSGVIALKTREPGKEWHVRTEDSYGSFRTGRYYAEVSGTTSQGLGLLVGGRYTETDGYRQNASHEGASALVKANGQVTEFLKIENTFYFADNETGIAGPLLPAEVQADRRQKDPDGQYGDKFNDRLVQDGLLFDYFAEPVAVQITNLTGYRLRDQDSVQSFGGAFPGTSFNEIGTETFSNVLQGTRSWGEKDRRYTVFTGFEWSIDDIHNPFLFQDATFGPFSTDRSIDRSLWGVFLQNRLELWERLVVDGGLRFDKINWNIYDLLTPSLEKHKKSDATSPQISASFEVVENVTFFAGYSDAFKVPDSNTLIFETPNLFTPTPDIEASIAHHMEAGVRVKPWEPVSARATFFHIETDKEILFNDITNRNENFDTTRDGVEASLDWQLTELLKVSGGFSFTDAEFDTGMFDGKRVPLVPETQWSAALEWVPVQDWTLRLEASGVDGRFALNDLRNLFEAEDYWTMDLEVRRALPKGEAFVKMTNSLGEEYSSFTTSDGVSVVNLNPAPEFQIEAGVRLEI